MEHRKCSGMCGVFETGNASMWHVWSTGIVVVWVEFWYKEMSALACMKHRKYNGNLTFNIQEIVPCTIPPCMQEICKFQDIKHMAKISPLL